MMPVPATVVVDGSGVAGSRTKTRKQKTSASGKKTGRTFPWALWCPRLPLDGGWCMVLLGAAAISHMTTGGIALANVVLLPHMLSMFNGTSYFQAAWAVSLSWSFGWLLSPLIAAMCVKYGARSMCVLGGFVAALGALFNSFSEDLIHVFLSFSIVTSFGSNMCQVATLTALGSGFTKNTGRIYRIYHSCQYIGMALFAYATDAAITHFDWIHGLQMTTVLVGINFVLGFCYKLPMLTREKSSPEKTPERAPLVLIDMLNSQVLRDRLLYYWYAVQTLLSLALRTPFFLMILYPRSSLATYNIVCAAGAAFVGTFGWQMFRRCVPTSSLFFLQELMVLCAVIISGMTMASSDVAVMVSTGVYGFMFGGLDTMMAAQTRHLIIKEHRIQADAWTYCSRAVGFLLGPPLIVLLNGVTDVVEVGYFVCSGLVLISAGVLLAIMRRLRIRELDISYIEQSSMAIKPHLCGMDRSMQRPPYAYGNGTVVDGVEDPDMDIREMVDPDILWQAGMLRDLEGPCGMHGMHLVGDFYDSEGEQTPDGVRRKTLAEPTLPILPEVPSQENSSVSRMDCSIHSGGRCESDQDTFVIMGSDEGGNSNAGFSTKDEKATSTSGSLLSVDTIPGAVTARTPKYWMRKGSLPEKRSPTTKWATLNRRMSVDPETLKSMMYLPIPKTSFSHDSVNVEINIVPPSANDSKADPIQAIFNDTPSDSSAENPPRKPIPDLFKQENKNISNNTDNKGTPMTDLSKTNGQASGTGNQENKPASCPSTSGNQGNGKSESHTIIETTV